ncbi:sugar phosphate nucleotidyltransferase [Vulcanisaeta souniana]|uniref:Mannose-1-phosphate guanyltransferase n=1 Tax=Vulcanisaeta souniana JCM 11219 TaxID=1293586 RepID=A0A830E4D1_9CREN|nr:NDP-sugar synthase [Vulcanisaeta souniana]BDR91125.1 mannose-1-phosphate guanyltransferase [Vulcanisaeta souniana JCM 11219]GGI81054.1 mannose-1-phosphate guanyltransferase [Vulcanisaeta souniana JCM 11219]
MKSYDVVILAGGLATRLRPLSYSRPKPLLPVLDKEIIDWIMESITRIPLNRVFISIRYMGDLIKEHMENTWAEFKDRLVFVTESKPLGDAGPIPLIDEKYELSDTFLVVYGDIFSDISTVELINFHEKAGGLATVTLTKVDDVSRYGVAQLDENNRIINFIEKPKQYVGSNLINAGFYVFTKETIKLMPRNPEGQIKLATDVIPRLLGTGSVYGYIHNGLWFDIGTPEDYLRANFRVLANRCSGTNNHCINTDLHPTVTIQPPVYLGPNVVVGNNTELGPNVIVHKNTKIGSTTKILNSLIFNGSSLCDGSYISGAIIGSNTYIGKWVRIEDGSVIGDGVYVKDYVFIAKNAKIGPYREIMESIYKDNEIIL